MSRLLNWLRRPAPTKRPCPSFRPRVESLEDRSVPNATSWFDAYHAATISAVTQETRADRVSFAIDETRHLTQFIGDIPLHPGKYKGAVAGGFATDIDAGRDAYGNAQVLVHGEGNTLSVYNVISGWSDVSFKTKYGNKVWQISAGNTGELYMLDSSHAAWKYEPATTDFGAAHWRMIGIGFTQIQASRGGFFETPGVFTISESGSVAHHTAAGWSYLNMRSESVTAHALSVNANGDVFIVDQDHSLRRYNWDTNHWVSQGGGNLQAINACTGPRRESLVYAYVDEVPDSGDLHGRVDLPIPVTLNTRGTGPLPSGSVWNYTLATGWEDLRLPATQFSGASGSTLYIGYPNRAFHPFPFEELVDWARGERTVLGHLW